MLKKKKKKGKRRIYTKHHILPSSRGGKDIGGNIAIVELTAHARYHRIFHNKTPDEIIRHLVYRYWNGQWHWVEKALDDHYAEQATKEMRNGKEAQPNGT